MRTTFTQGSVIQFVRSTKYPDIQCWGIVITARCDLANDKVKSIHLLTALPLESWIEEVLFYDIVEEKIKMVTGDIKSFSQKYNLNYDLLMEFGPVKSQTAIIGCGASKKEQTQILGKCNTWEKLITISSSPLTCLEKKGVLAKEKKLLKNKLQELHNSKSLKYCFIPEKAYINSSNSSLDGIVVDLYDIQQFSCCHCKPILEGSYDYQTIKSDSEKDQLNQIFFFENKDHYILESYQIQSPWIEYLLQHFANAFTRIGVDNARKDEVELYCDYYCTQMEEQR